MEAKFYSDRVHQLAVYSFIFYLMFWALVLIRIVVYLAMRMHVRQVLQHKERSNPDFFNSPDCCAVFWCSPCVLCQHAREADIVERAKVMPVYQRV